MALLLLGWWWALILCAVLAWRLAPARSNGSWLLPLQAGLIGWQWAFVGATALGTWPQHRLQVFAMWIAWPVLLIFAVRGFRGIV
jgi:hypothetical protein